MAAPQQHVSGPLSWPRSRAWVDGRPRLCRYQQLRHRWAVSGPHLPVPVCVIETAGEVAPWFLVTSAVHLSAAPGVEAWTARCRQEDGCRDPKQHLGMEACRAWTKEPMRRTLQVQPVTLTRRRLLPARLEQAWGPDTRWCKPEGHPPTRQASSLDLRRLCWRYRTEFSPCLVHLAEREEFPQPLPQSRDLWQGCLKSWTPLYIVRA